MAKIKTVKQYREKLGELNKQGRKPVERASEKQKKLEGETADFGRALHDDETKGRPRPNPRRRVS